LPDWAASFRRKREGKRRGLSSSRSARKREKERAFSPPPSRYPLWERGRRRKEGRRSRSFWFPMFWLTWPGGKRRRRQIFIFMITPNRKGKEVGKKSGAGLAGVVLILAPPRGRRKWLNAESQSKTN